MFVYVWSEDCAYCPDKVEFENITISLNEWADLWPNDIFFFSEQEL